MGQLHCLLDQIKGTHLKQNVTDSKRWKQERTGVCSVLVCLATPFNLCNLFVMKL
jgi:hypothetical protein